MFVRNIVLTEMMLVLNINDLYHIQPIAHFQEKYMFMSSVHHIF